MGNMVIDHGGIVQFELQGTNPGTEYDRVDVGQNLTIGSADLDLEVSGFTPLDGQSFFILDNEGSNPISGQFSNALEGATITAGGYLFTITYFADADTLSLTGGNDVALTEIGVVPIPEPATNLLALSAAALLATRISRRKPRR